MVNSKASLMTENFNRNLQKLQVASKLAIETYNLVSTIQENLTEMIMTIKKKTHIHPIASIAKKNKRFTPSQIVKRYWPEQNRVLGKINQKILRINVVFPQADENPACEPSVDEESKQIPSKYEDNFICPVCLSITEDAVELSCCSTIMCEKCSTQLNRTCPNCRRNFVAKPSIPIRRLIVNIVWRCTCGHSTTRSERNSHLDRCPEQLKCKFKDCLFSGDVADLKMHLLSAHVDDILAEYC
jgi:hypothetical protein